jgi:hypothetical protein
MTPKCIRDRAYFVAAAIDCSMVYRLLLATLGALRQIALSMEGASI